ncbi:pancreatic lipase-related protein 2-like [Ochlerotatus camptorhynchus]|uniref:pancreatic lipase-related protein 2-like n=1 Tax=Ochlerotatus camptorhynchus TaxID=644619 RepID=UPI0031D5374D
MFLVSGWIILAIAISRIDCGLLDMFNANSDYNLAQSMDAVFGALQNDISYMLTGDLTTTVEEDVTFWCSNGSSTVLRQATINDSYISQKIDPSKQVSFVIHGWMDDMSLNWFQQLVQDVLKFYGGNVCAVNWGHLARYNYYRTAVNHTMIASGYLTKFVQFLQTTGVPMEKITMIGHSMGAQISGQVGYNLGGRIGKIYGLDPAGPCFTLPRDRGLQYRLDRSDARYVQTIITSRLTIGVGVGEGHENFYPNGGASPQTNCVIPLTSDAEFAGQILCSHMHSTTLFRLSLNPSLVYRGKKCINWPSYLLGLCGLNKANVLGIHSDKSGGDYFLRTAVFSPYTVRL